jgi:hypothetical protein
MGVMTGWMQCPNSETPAGDDQGGGRCNAGHHSVCVLTWHIFLAENLNLISDRLIEISDFD